jgi:DNA-binding winged helix-turn-helix (wHTH) protein
VAQLPVQAVRIRFGPFTVDSETRQLRRQQLEIHLSPKAFDLLWILLERRPKVLGKAELHTRIWPDTHVGDANLNVLIGEIRKAMEDKAERPRFIRTVHGIGYAFCGEAHDVDEPAATARARTTRCWLVWRNQTFPLSEGDNIIGRDPQCSVWLDASGVSRQHARIQIDSAARTASLGDLNSTNGTFLRRSPVGAREPLTDGDVIEIGSVELQFREWSQDKPRETERIRRKAP